MANIARIEFNFCKDCPFSKKEQYYTADPFEDVMSEYCSKIKDNTTSSGYKLRGIYDWNDLGKLDTIPEYCPFCVK